MADLDLALERVGLALFVEGHDHDGGAVARRPCAPRRRNLSSPSFIEIELTTPLPCRHFRPASITSNFEESTITGTRAMSGSAATRLRNSTIALLRIEQAFVHIDVDDLRAIGHLIARHFERGGVIARGDQLAEFRRARDIGALADIDEGDVLRQRERLQPRKPQQRLDVRNRRAGLTPFADFGDGRDMRRASCRSSRRRY